jgi:hypothetical protein
LTGGGVGAGAGLPGSDSAAINLQLRFFALSHIIAAVLQFSDEFRCRSIGVFENNSVPRMQAPRRAEDLHELSQSSAAAFCGQIPGRAIDR